ncbi:MAG: MFS transporter [Chloroflexota bacterium]
MTDRSDRAVGLVVLLFVVMGVVNAVFTPFGSAILVDRGISATWLGVIGASISLLHMGLAGVWGHVADVILGRGRALSLALLIAAGLLAVYALPLPLALVGFAYVVFGAVYGLLFPLQDAIAVNTLRDPARQYGLVRGLQSGVFAVCAIGAGVPGRWWAWARRGRLHRHGGAGDPGGLADPGRRSGALATQRRGGAVREALTMQPRLVRVLLAIGLANIGVFAGFTFLPLLVVRLGGGAGAIGVAVGVTAAVELVALPGVSRLIGRFGPRRVVAVGIALMAVIFGSFAVAPSPEWVIAAAVLYGFAWSAMWAGSVATIGVLLPATLQATGQSLIALTTSGIAAFAANVGGGLLWASQGPIAVFGLSAAFALAGSVIAWASLPDGASPMPEPGARGRARGAPEG